MKIFRKPGLATGLASALALSSVPALSSDCDRDCLVETIDGYVAALAAGEPSHVEFSDDVVFVEDIERREIGEGLWRTLTGGYSDFVIHAADPQAGQVGVIAVLEVEGEPAEVAIRLHLNDEGEISEVEHLKANRIREEAAPNLVSARPGFKRRVAREDRTPRERMRDITLRYYDAIVESDGSLAPFALECERRENGIQVTGDTGGSLGVTTCESQLDTGIMSYIKRIEPRRVEIIDEEYGLTMAFSQFRHPMEESEVEVQGPDGPETIELGFDEPFDLPAAHIFKIHDGLIYEIEALGFIAPYNASTGWD